MFQSKSDSIVRAAVRDRTAINCIQIFDASQHARSRFRRPSSARLRTVEPARIFRPPHRFRSAAQPLRSRPLGTLVLQRTTLRFVIATKAQPESFARILSLLMEKNQQWAKECYVIGFSAAKKTFTQSGAPDRFGLYDTGAASASLAI